MKVIRLSQVTDTKNLKSRPDGSLQNRLMEKLDDMRRATKRIKETPSKGPHMDTQLFPRKRIAKVDSLLVLSFKEAPEARDSYWEVRQAGQMERLTLAELFPSGEYDISEVRSGRFGDALGDYLENGQGSLSEMCSELRSDAGTHGDVKMVSSSLFQLSPEDREEIACDSVPLNDLQKGLRDMVAGG